jgi:hypothetical protein
MERLKVCEEKCEYFCKHGHAYRKKHLQNRLSIAKAKKNKKAEQQILEIIRRERERALWRRLNYTMGKKRGRGVSAVQVKQAEALRTRPRVRGRWRILSGTRYTANASTLLSRPLSVRGG